MIPPTHLDVLRKLYRILAEDDLLWVITGSLGFALQGVDLPVHDMDVQTDQEGAYEMERKAA